MACLFIFFGILLSVNSGQDPNEAYTEEEIAEIINKYQDQNRKELFDGFYLCPARDNEVSTDSLYEQNINEVLLSILRLFF